METKFILDGLEMSNLQPGLKSSFKCKPKTLTALKLHTWDSQSFSQTVNSELKQWVWSPRLHEWQPEVWCLAWWNTFVSHNESECLCFNSCCTNLLSQISEREKMATRSRFFLPLSGTSIFSLRKVPNEFTMSFISAVKLLINAEYISFLFIKEVIIALQQSCQRCILGQIWFQRNFDLNEVDSQFPLSCSPKRQRKLKINLV